MNEHVTLRIPPVGYDADFFAWTVQQVNLLRAGRTDIIDIENIAEEIESSGQSDRRGIQGQLVRLIAHLLKLKFARDLSPRQDWQVSVTNARIEIELALDDSPSLRRMMPELYLGQWQRGSRLAKAELKTAGDHLAVTSVALFEQQPAFTLEQTLDPDFFPGD